MVTKCWFPYTKLEFPQSKVHFSNKRIMKMITESYEPNDVDGAWFEVKILAGPLDKEILARNVSKTLSSQSESDNSDQSANDESDDSYTKTKKAGRQRKPKKLFSPEQGQKRRKVIESSSIPPIPVPPKIPINSSVFIELSSNNDDVDKRSYLNNIQCEGRGKIYKEHNNGYDINNSDDDLLSETINSFLKNVSANDFVLEDDNNISAVEVQTQEISNIQPNCNYASSPVTPEIENEENKIGSPSPSHERYDDHNIESKTQNIMNDSRISTNEITELKKMIHEQTIEFKKRDQNVMLQLLMLVRSNSKICEAVQNIDKKVGYMMKADTRTRALALPSPNIPLPFINLLPTQTIENVTVVENILSNIDDGFSNKEQLKSYILMKVGTMSFSASIRNAIACCFDKDVLKLYSYKGKTKKKFIGLHLFDVIYEALSGFRLTPEDERHFHQVADNYIRHAAIEKKEEIPNPKL